jgi:hypothetical protein
MYYFSNLTGPDIVPTHEEWMTEAATWRQIEQAERARKAEEGGARVRSVRVHLAHLLHALAMWITPNRASIAPQ